jgi:hypothetical protein
MQPSHRGNSVQEHLEESRHDSNVQQEPTQVGVSGETEKNWKIGQGETRIPLWLLKGENFSIV